MSGAVAYSRDVREVLGRRPLHRRLRPSRPTPPWWWGTWRDDRRFTSEQDAALIALGRDPVTSEAIEVRREIDVYSGEDSAVARLNEWLPVYAFDCPVIGKGAGNTVRIIAPNGKPRDVRPDGWAHTPSRHPFMGARF